MTGLVLAAVCLGHATGLWPELVCRPGGPCAGARVDDRVEVFRSVRGACPTTVCTVTPPCPNPPCQLQAARCQQGPISCWIKVVDTEHDPNRCNIPAFDDGNGTAYPRAICNRWPVFEAFPTMSPGIEYDHFARVYDRDGALRAEGVVWSCVAGPMTCYANGGTVPCR